MLLFAKVRGFKDPVPHSPAILGYSVSVEGAAVRCKQLVVHHQTKTPALKVTLLERGAKPRRVSVEWPGYKAGVYREVTLYALTNQAERKTKEV